MSVTLNTQQSVKKKKTEIYLNRLITELTTGVWPNIRMILIDSCLTQQDSQSLDLELFRF